MTAPRLVLGIVGLVVLFVVLLVWAMRPESPATMSPKAYEQLLRDHKRTLDAARVFLRNGSRCARYGHRSDPVCGHRVENAMDVRLQPGFRLVCKDDTAGMSPDPCIKNGPCARALARYDTAWAAFHTWWAGVYADPDLRGEDTALELFPHARQNFPAWRDAIDSVRAACRP
jgi:hypothetical protein